MKKYTLILKNDYHPTTTITLETTKDFETKPSKKQIQKWLKEVDDEFNFPYDYYNITN